MLIPTWYIKQLNISITAGGQKQTREINKLREAFVISKKDYAIPAHVQCQNKNKENGYIYVYI